MIDLRLPNINGATEREQLKQLKSYLYQLVEQLNLTLKNISSGGTSSNTNSLSRNISDQVQKQHNPQSTFNSIKGLIIKSADVVKALSDEVSKRMDGVYIAESEFGTFMEETGADIVLNSSEIKATFENVQTLTTSVEGLTDSVQTDGVTTKIISSVAWAKIGALESDEETGHYLYGMEIGQVNDD